MWNKLQTLYTNYFCFHWKSFLKLQVATSYLEAFSVGQYTSDKHDRLCCVCVSVYLSFCIRSFCHWTLGAIAFGDMCAFIYSRLIASISSIAHSYDPLWQLADVCFLSLHVIGYALPLTTGHWACVRVHIYEFGLSVIPKSCNPNKIITQWLLFFTMMVDPSESRVSRYVTRHELQCWWV